MQGHLLAPKASWKPREGSRAWRASDSFGGFCSISATSCWVLFSLSTSHAKFTLIANLRDVYFSGRQHLPRASLSSAGKAPHWTDQTQKQAQRQHLRAKPRAALAVGFSGQCHVTSWTPSMHPDNMASVFPDALARRHVPARDSGAQVETDGPAAPTQGSAGQHLPVSKVPAFPPWPMSSDRHDVTSCETGT